MLRDFKEIDICYNYDGSFYGMLSCVFESFEKNEMPLQISSEGSSLFPIKQIQSDENKAERILKAVKLKIGDEALNYIKLSFLAKIDQKELALIHFLKYGFFYGHKFIEVINTGFSPCRRVIACSTKNSFIAKIAKGVDLLTLEAQRFIQFIRFSDFDGALISTIEPEHIVLPLLADHFIERYVNEQFLIYDKINRMGLIYTDHKARIEFLEDYAMPNLTEEEKSYQKLWRLFYDTVAIKERRNERCRMNFMPKKYWKNMTEFLKD